MNGLLVCAGEGSTKNIGDQIQSLAQKQFFDSIDCMVERESINSFSASEKVRLIMNAWWMWHPENFPPADCIDPLFISMHVVPKIEDKFFTKETTLYLKNHEPIGARDYNTMRMMEAHGIKSYFSGCLTLTLGKTYKSELHGDSIIFVDPYYELGCVNSCYRIVQVLSSFFCLFKNLRIVFKLKNKFTYEFNAPFQRLRMSKLGNLLQLASFIESYKACFTLDTLINAEYISHDVPQSLFKDEKDRLNYAEGLLRKYSKAKMIITSRIHCALPCIGIETPVLFVNSEKLAGSNLIRSSGRFEGLVELMHSLKWDFNGVGPNDEYTAHLLSEGKISGNTHVDNPNAYKGLVESMTQIINVFLNK